ncbi:MAG: DUF5716 family protein [bacterium]|nr:DUF5716 family protein [bacterium]
MERLKEIPEQFFGLFQSKNRYIYMEALLLIYEEYLYNDYFLSKETCIQLLHDRFNNRIFDLSEEEEMVAEKTEPVATQIFAKLLYFKWLRKVEDYQTFKTNVVIPDYASIFIEAMIKIKEPGQNETDIYIQNVYTNIYSFYHDKKAGIELLKTAMVNTSNLNRALQDMLHNMDKFFESLLQKDSYENLLEEHLYGYVESIVDRKYSLLKTSDNFYIYKNDIKTLLRAIQEDDERLNLLKRKMILEGTHEGDVEEQISEMIDAVERGIGNMERRIAYIDSEHTKYVRATVRRLEYLLNNDENMTGRVVNVLNLFSNQNQEQLLGEIAKKIKIHDHTMFGKDLMYTKRGRRKSFEETVEVLEEAKMLTKEEILLANRKKHRFSKEQIEIFVADNMSEGQFDTAKTPITSDEEFELLILAYDHSLRKKSPYTVEATGELITTESYSYPRMTFRKRDNRPKEEADDRIL